MSRVPCLLIAAALSAFGAAVLRADSDDVYETDRPAEIENPYALPPGEAEWVNYVAAVNAAARQDLFGAGGSGTDWDSALRFGLAPGWEGEVAADTLLPGSRPAAGAGYGTVLAKWNFIGSPAQEFGVGLAPYVRLPLNRLVAGTAQSAPGFSLPFNVDLEGGWELEGATSVAWPGPEGETQVELEREFGAGLSAYVEPEIQYGEDAPEWGVEFGVAFRLSRRVSLDVGSTLGIGRRSDGRMVYAGAGWRL